MQPGKRPSSREAGDGRRVENFKVTNPRANGCRGPAAVAPRLEVEGGLSAAPRGTGGSWAPREARDSEKTQELEVLTQHRNFGPGSQENLLGPRAPKPPEHQSLSPGLRCRRAGTECRNPSPAQKQLGHYAVPLAILAALSRGPSWGEGSGAHGGDLRGDPGSRRAFSPEELAVQNRTWSPLGRPGEAEQRH